MRGFISQFLRGVEGGLLENPQLDNGGFLGGWASITNIYRLKIGESGMGDLESGEKITGNG